MADQSSLTPEAKSFVPDVGDIVGILYWNPSPFAGGTGKWEAIEGRVLSVGRNGRVCFETTASTWCGDNWAIQGTKHRIVDGSRVYESAEHAAKVAPTLPPSTTP